MDPAALALYMVYAKNIWMQRNRYNRGMFVYCSCRTRYLLRHCKRGHNIYACLSMYNICSRRSVSLDGLALRFVQHTSAGGVVCYVADGAYRSFPHFFIKITKRLLQHIHILLQPLK